VKEIVKGAWDQAPFSYLSQTFISQFGFEKSNLNKYQALLKILLVHMKSFCYSGFCSIMI
jgi:hypothetical protein